MSHCRLFCHTVCGKCCQPGSDSCSDVGSNQERNGGVKIQEPAGGENKDNADNGLAGLEQSSGKNSDSHCGENLG